MPFAGFPKKAARHCSQQAPSSPLVPATPSTLPCTFGGFGLSQSVTGCPKYKTWFSLLLFAATTSDERGGRIEAMETRLAGEVAAYVPRVGMALGVVIFSQEQKPQPNEQGFVPDALWILGKTVQAGVRRQDALFRKEKGTYPLSQNDYRQEKLFSNYFRGFYRKIL